MGKKKDDRIETLINSIILIGMGILFIVGIWGIIVVSNLPKLPEDQKWVTDYQLKYDVVGGELKATGYFYDSWSGKKKEGKILERVKEGDCSLIKVKTRWGTHTWRTDHWCDDGEWVPKEDFHEYRTLRELSEAVDKLEEERKDWYAFKDRIAEAEEDYIEWKANQERR